VDYPGFPCVDTSELLWVDLALATRSGRSIGDIAGASISLSACDLAGLLKVAGEMNDAKSGVTDVPSLLALVRRLVGCDLLFWNRTQLEPRRLIAEVGYPSAPATPDVSYEEWARHVDEHPIMCGRYEPVVAISDVYSAGQFRNTWMYQNAFKPHVQHEIGVHLSHRPGQLHVVSLCRGRGRDFSSRDHLVLQLLQPHLDSAFRRSAFPAPPLTPRETEVMRWVREGCGNTQIARRMGISEGTVEKHLEHIYARTGARSRVQALNVCAAALD
jgi:DNA-binding CsgD family transcriptional regulator